MESGRNRIKKSSTDMGEEITVNNIKFKRTSPSVTRSNTLKRDNSATSITSGKDSDYDDTKRQKVTKHNSLMYPSGRRPSMKRFTDMDIFRRKSVAAMNAPRDGTLSRSSSKWSLHRDSAIDAQWKGIRWKPFKKEELYAINPESSVLSEDRLSQVASFPDEYASYVNQAFSSPIEELSASRLMFREKKDKENSESIDQDGNKTSTKYDKTNFALQDSLV